MGDNIRLSLLNDDQHRKQCLFCVTFGHVLTLDILFYVSILVWSGRELRWAFHVLFYVFVLLSLAWYGSQSEAAVYRCL